MLTFADVFLGGDFKSYCAQAFDSKRHRLNTGVGEARANVSISERVYFPEMLYLYTYYTCISVYLYTCILVYLYTCILVYLYTCISLYLYTRVVKILELTETTGDGPTAPNGFWKTLRANSGPCNVMLRPFRISSLGRHIQPATMIGFKQIEFFDHTGLVSPTFPRRGPVTSRRSTQSVWQCVGF